LVYKHQIYTSEGEILVKYQFRFIPFSYLIRRELFSWNFWSPKILVWACSAIMNKAHGKLLPKATKNSEFGVTSTFMTIKSQTHTKTLSKLKLCDWKFALCTILSLSFSLCWQMKICVIVQKEYIARVVTCPALKFIHAAGFKKKSLNIECCCVFPWTCVAENRAFYFFISLANSRDLNTPCANDPK
jgi:hypothetical protein